MSRVIHMMMVKGRLKCLYEYSQLSEEWIVVFKPPIDHILKIIIMITTTHKEKFKNNMCMQLIFFFVEP